MAKTKIKDTEKDNRFHFLPEEIALIKSITTEESLRFLIKTMKNHPDDHGKPNRKNKTLWCWNNVKYHWRPEFKEEKNNYYNNIRHPIRKATCDIKGQAKRAVEVKKKRIESGDIEPGKEYEQVYFTNNKTLEIEKTNSFEQVVINK